MEIDDKNVVFVLTREDVVECARQMGVPEERGRGSRDRGGTTGTI